MDYDKIPALIKKHEERKTRCESIIRELAQGGQRKPELQFPVEINDRYLSANVEECVAILNIMIRNSDKALIILRKQHARLQKVSAKFK